MPAATTPKVKCKPLQGTEPLHSIGAHFDAQMHFNLKIWAKGEKTKKLNEKYNKAKVAQLHLRSKLSPAGSQTEGVQKTFNYCFLDR